MFAIWDRDVLSRDDSLGQAVLEFSSIIENFMIKVNECTAGEQHVAGDLEAFDLPVILNSESCGRVKGRIQVVGSQVKLRHYMSSLSKSGVVSCCFR